MKEQQKNATNITEKGKNFGQGIVRIHFSNTEQL